MVELIVELLEFHQNTQPVSCLCNKVPRKVLSDTKFILILDHLEAGVPLSSCPEVSDR